MALSSSIVIADHAAVNKTFVGQAPIVGGSNRLDSSTNLATPRTMSIRHSANGKGSSATDRHLVQFQVTKADVNGNPSYGTVNVTIALGRSGAVVASDILDLIAFAKNFLSDANVASLLINES